MRHYKLLGTVAIIAMTAGAVLTPTIASAIDFKGKKITAIVPFKEGGGTDKIIRLFVPFFSKHLPGKPTIIVRNMPGGGSIRGNNFFQTAKPDGLTFTGVSTSSQTGFVLGGKKVKFDLKTWKYILSTPRGTIIYARPETGVKGKDLKADVMALRKAALVTGAKNPTSAELRLFLGLEMLGAKNVKAVFGLSTGKMRKATLRGELNINYDTGGSYQKSVMKYVKNGTVVPIMSLGFTRKGKIGRDPAYPKLPTIIEAYQAVNGGNSPSGPLFEAYKNFYTMGVMTSKGFALPPKTPNKVANAYITAAKKIIKDKKFWKLAKKRLGNYPIDFGDDAKANFMAAIDISPEVRAFMKKFIKAKFDANI